jgi:methylated-DNA-[protein]-cysteine S-methyltransferase
MSEHGFTLFDTAVGQCGIAWGARGIVGVQLPERSDSATRARLLRRYPSAEEAPPPPGIQHAIDNIAALLRGDARDLSTVELDMDRVPPFHQLVYAVARTIPPGATLSYGKLAARLGDRGVARDVGEAMGQNPFPIIVPCHRVVAAGGRRRHDEAASARRRRRADRRDAHAVRKPPVGRAAPTRLAHTSRPFVLTPPTAPSPSWPGLTHGCPVEFCVPWNGNLIP